MEATATDLVFEPRVLNEYLVCGICNGYVRDALTITECLHKFCKSCIFKHFMDNDNCPVCNKDLSPDPFDFLRYDHTLQSLVDKIFPHFAENEEKEEQAFYQQRGLPIPPPTSKTNLISPAKPPSRTQRAASAAGSGSGSTSTATNSTSTTPSSVNKQVTSPQKQGQKQAKSSESKAKGATPKGADTKRQKVSQIEQEPTNQESVSFELVRDPEDTGNLGSLEKPYIRTSSKISIGHLQKYLAVKLSVPISEIEITYRGMVLGHEHSLEYILKSHGVSGEDSPVFKYRTVKNFLI